METKEKNEVDKLIEANFSAARKKAKTTKGIESCSCGKCSCPGGTVAVGEVSADAEVIGYAGGYGGDLAYHLRH
jgi:hypothetical protein